MGLATAHFIRESHEHNECQNYIVYGPLGIGKTSYALTVLTELYKKEIERDGLIQTISRYFFHTPLEMLQMVRKLDKQVMAIAGDDLGVWLYSLDYQKPLVKSIVKMFQMIRTKTSAVIMNTPTPTLILGKLRCFPQTITIKIKKKLSPEYRAFKDLRIATAYRAWLLPDLQKLRIKKLYIDEFSCLVDTELWEWCNKKRETYVRILEDEIESNLPKQMQTQLQEASKEMMV